MPINNIYNIFYIAHVTCPFTKVTVHFTQKVHSSRDNNVEALSKYYNPQGDHIIHNVLLLAFPEAKS